MTHKIQPHSGEQDTEALRSQLLPLFFLTSIFFLNFTIRIILSPLLPTILEDMSLTRDQASSFFLVSAGGYFISLLCSGFVSSRILHKQTIVLSAVATGIAFLFTGLSQSLVSMRMGIFIVGMAAGLYLPSGIAMLTASIRPENWGKAIGIHELAPNLSFLLAPVICEGLLLLISWRGVLVVTGGMSILLGLLFFKFSTVKDFPGDPPMLKSLLPLTATPSFWMMITLFSLGVTGTMGVYSMLPLYLVNEHGMLQSQANTLITISRILTVPILASILFITGLTTLFTGILTGRMLQVIIFCQPVFAVCFFPPAFAALSHIGSKKTRNITVSFTIPIAFLVGGGVVPNLIGILGENGLFSTGFMVAGIVILSGTLIPFFLKFQKD